MKPPVYHGEKVRIHYFNLRSLHFFRTFSFVENLKTRQISIRLLSPCKTIYRVPTQFRFAGKELQIEGRRNDWLVRGRNR